MDALQAYLKGKSYSHLIWDWNGTLLNDFELCHEIITSELKNAGLPEIHRTNHKELFRFPVRAFYQSLGFDLEACPFEEFAERFHRLYRTRVKNCQLFEEAEQFLEKTWAEGVSHAILSAAAESDLKTLVDHFGIRKFFTHVYGLPDGLATSKVQRGMQLLEAWKIDPSKALLIGDTDHDLEVGNAIGVDVLLIADGHQTFEKLCRVHGEVLKSRKTSIHS